MAWNTPVEMDGLHWLLWYRRTGEATIQINQRQLAAELMLTAPTMNKIIRKMILAGRLSKLAGPRGSAYQTFEIVDPDTWSPAG